MAELIPAPVLDIRDEAQLAADAIARVSGGLTLALIDQRIATMRALRDKVAAGGLPPPACPELTNANPSAPHVAFLEGQSWQLGQVTYFLNQLPRALQIEFARLFGITLNPATKATTTLRFTVAPPPNTPVTIPAGTDVATSDGSYIFETTAALTIPAGSTSGEVAAARTVAGATLLSPNTLTVLRDPVAYVAAVTNPAAIDSGADAETVDSALTRMKLKQRRGERLVTAKDMEDAVLQEAMGGTGIVRAFNYVVGGDFSNLKAGHTTLIAMTRSGLAVGSEVKTAINNLLKQIVGNQYTHVNDPTYVDFSVSADIRLSAGAPQTGVIPLVETALRNFYAASDDNFGRAILRSEIIAIIEGTAGVDSIAADASGQIILTPATDRTLKAWELPRLVTVTIRVV